MKTSKKIKVLKNKLDKMWSKAVLKKGACEYCGRTSETNQLHAHHVFGRVNKATRWHFDNGICLCASHHTRNSGFSAHLTPAEFMEWIREHRGEEWYQELNQRRLSIYKVNLGNLETTKEELEQIMLDMETKKT